jgi:pimeloyl-ACP methyl ester carboxylesterase
MGKRTSQVGPHGDPLPRKKRRTLIGSVVRVGAVVVGVVAVLFLIGGWHFSNQIESGALAPPKSGPPDFEWTVTDVGSTISLQAGSTTDQAGEAGLSGLWWDGGYGQSGDLISSSDGDGGYTDVRSLQPGTPTPQVGTDLKVDFYYWRGTPADIGVDYTTVRYSSDIGSFPAWFIEGDSDTWAIVLHGKGGTPEEALRIIPILQAEGYPILVINYRNDVGQERDPSGRHTYGVSDWVDVAAAVTYARDNGARDHVLVGYSYAGSMIAGFLTQSPLRNSTKAAILDSPVLSFSDAVDFRASNTDLPLLPIKVPQVLTDFSKWIASWRFDVDWAASNYLEQTNNYFAPTLIFHGTSDISVPHDTSVAMAEERPDIVTLVSTDAGHTRSWNIGPDAYEAAIAEFLDSLD